ncbi:OmpA family protein [uncultured Muribaculum sp.]|uniref:OmpA family protein n=1 Tax=uncultured Muribaculum sp. TaxID=1918613 RepID=UPI0026292EE7|nr:OmpA family protein [uncultured Muribaculum sp.]
MKKNILFGFAVCGAMLMSANVAQAQEAVVIEEATFTEVAECADHYYSQKNDNWFIQIGAGIETPIVEHYNPGHGKHHITAAYGVGFGKWFTPYLAWRVSAQAAAYHFEACKAYQKAKFVNGNIDLMWDMFNSLGGVNADRAFSIVPFVGVGASYSWDFNHAYTPINGGDYKTRVWQIPVSVGLQLRFRLSQYVDLFAEGRYSFYGDTFDGIAYGTNSIDMNMTAMAGLTFNLGGKNFKSFNPCEYLGYINQLNGQINDLRGELANCGARLAAAEAQLPCPEVVAVECPEAGAPLMSTVRFTINSAKITSLEAVNVFNIAQWMKANPEAKVVIKGYADKDTGTAAYNMKLSERRAQNVYNMLTKEYGISADRLTIKAEGSDSQIYDTNNWNRIVIFSQD